MKIKTIVLAIGLLLMANYQLSAQRTGQPPKGPIQKENPAKLPGQAKSAIIRCPASVPIKFLNLPDGWIDPGLKLFFTSATVNDEPPPNPQQYLYCNYTTAYADKSKPDGSTFIYRAMPAGACKLAADQKSFVCTP